MSPFWSGFLRRERRLTHHIVFYTRDGCGLCRGVAGSLAELQHEYALTIQEIDITTDAALYERYKNVIPVVIVDGRVTLQGRISENDLRSVLARKRHADR